MALRFSVRQITVDGLDATERLSKMLLQIVFDVVILAGVSFAGFNLIDSRYILKELKKPAIIVARTEPDNVSVMSALRQHFKD